MDEKTVVKNAPLERYVSLDIDGICRPGEKIKPGGIYVNKYSPTNTSESLVNPDTMPETCKQLHFSGVNVQHGSIVHQHIKGL